MVSRRILAVLACVTVVLLSGCSGLKIRKGPVAVWSETELAKLRERSEHWRGYQAMVHVTAETEKGRLQRVKTLVLAVPPDRFRLEAMSPFGSTLGLLLVEPAGASLWVPSQQALVTADRAESLVKQVLGVPLPVEAFAYGLAAAVPPDQLKAAAPEAGKDGLVLEAREPLHGWSFSWYFSKVPFALQRLEVRDGNHHYTVTYDPPVPVEQEAVPNRISVSSAEGSIEVKVNEIKSAPALQEAAFRVKFPEGLRRIELGPGPWKGKDL